MIVPDLHRQPVSLDRDKHRRTVLQVPVTDWTLVGGMNAVFVTAAECAQLAAEFPLVFIKAGQDEQGQVDYAPIAVFGLTQGENLYVENGQWRASMMPGQLAMYPFCVARVNAERYAVCIDQSWSGIVEEGEGERLFDDQGEPTAFTQRIQGELERLEAQIDQTRAVGRRLAALGLLHQRRFDATLPDGGKVAVDGFYVVDEEKVKALPDQEIVALQRSGILGLISAHWISMGHMRRLLNWRLERASAGAPAA